MRILIFENDLNGHHIEYIHHLHLLAERMPENQFYFVVPKQFAESGSEFEWGDSSNICFDFFCDPVEVGPSRLSLVELMRIQKKIAKKLNHYILKFSIDRIISISVFDYFPFVPFFLRKRIQIDGIQYSLFPWRERNVLFRYADYLKYFFYVLFPCFHTIYTLNDNTSAEHLNKVLKTNKFKYLPDPYLPLSEENVTDIRKEFNIDESKTIFSHIGGMCYRKGTLYILSSIKKMSQEERDSSAFIFAGKIYKDIRDEFYRLYEELKTDVQIIVKDEFCSYSFLASICKCSNAILMPYLLTCQSSGLFGYASQFGVPVVAPDKNLIGSIVREYELGYMVKENSATGLLSAYNDIRKNLVPAPDSKYCSDHSVNSFIECIKTGLSELNY